MFGEKLKELRSEFRLTQADVAEFLGISQDAISKIEHEKRTLTSLEMFRLSKRLDIPTGFFFGEVNLNRFRAIYYKATEDLSRADKKKVPILREIAQKQYDIEEVLTIRHDAILRKYPVDQMDRSIIQEIALAERGILGFDAQEPIDDLLGLLRSRGLKILQPILDFAINGMFLTLDKSRFLIIINDDNSPAVRNFALAHEYGHYLMNRAEAFNVVSRNVEDSERLDQKEKIASAFAAEFLMPSKSLGDFFITDESIARYMLEYRVSRHALVYRLDNLGKMDADQKKYYLEKYKPIEALKKLDKLGLESDEVKHNAKVQAIKKWSPTRREKRKELKPRDLLSAEYKRMILTAYERGLITYDKTADYLFLNKGELKKSLPEKEVYYEI